jgi:importin-5
VVISQAGAVFVYVAQALEADALSGQTAARVIAATKQLLLATQTDGEALLQQNFTPEAQQLIRGHFA